jgi:hypothetical protein
LATGLPFLQIEMPLPDNNNQRPPLSYRTLLCACLFIGSAASQAATASESGFNAALPLFLLGVSALLMGIRNLRALRHKPLARKERRQGM